MLTFYLVEQRRGQQRVAAIEPPLRLGIERFDVTRDIGDILFSTATACAGSGERYRGENGAKDGSAKQRGA